ncbi:hypothetical protein HYC85_022650 [Camellia sinensis]|uniref:Uncharacterized protein n=1 Tax=Camellia sinensis TaxID=4442 RepID=A0A7J7GEM7_CAMSI|nr:hypothetical protein HYC85_022650 [Camellia sinensis]
MDKQLLELIKIHIDKNPADMLTKVVSRDKLEICRDIAGMDFKHWAEPLNSQIQWLAKGGRTREGSPKAERTKGHLPEVVGKNTRVPKVCRQMAQENGFLDIITNNKDIIYHKKCPFSFNIMRGNTSPQTPPPSPVLVHYHHHYCDLVTLINQAKMNGWYVEPHEIELHGKVAQGSTAKIYKATWRGLDVAVKCANLDFFHSNEN